MYYMHNLIFNMQRTMVLGHRSFCFHFTITIFIEMNLMRLYITIIMDSPITSILYRIYPLHYLLS